MTDPTKASGNLDDSTMTVGELIAALQEFDLRLPVYTEGCDCYGTALGVIREDDRKAPSILICREKTVKKSS